MCVKLFLKDLDPTFIPYTPQALNTYRVIITPKMCGGKFQHTLMQCFSTALCYLILGQNLCIVT